MGSVRQPSYDERSLALAQATLASPSITTTREVQPPAEKTALANVLYHNHPKLARHVPLLHHCGIKQPLDMYLLVAGDFFGTYTRFEGVFYLLRKNSVEELVAEYDGPSMSRVECLVLTNHVLKLVRQHSTREAWRQYFGASELQLPSYLVEFPLQSNTSSWHFKT
ncbi:hypothetical protein MIND_01142400 [Mycena indigotica]|uniref:Uncharacterized protein n=1 Tax=Mycena indigotica TaxID=2126181 RepID=A0A8H6S5S7_9AGAR|nr:uncharacterized protein MIND_01142400 [Mycena indigotica]KAF7293630.1 hypothetical protein MIND_01142400 [Mycena indigotica]